MRNRPLSPAAEAFSAVCASPPDVLLSDITMRDEDGYTLLRRIRQIEAAHLPAAALSARSDSETKAHAADAGFHEYLTKPIDPSSLAHALARLVDRGPIPLTSSD